MYLEQYFRDLNTLGQVVSGHVFTQVLQNTASSHPIRESLCGANTPAVRVPAPVALRTTDDGALVIALTTCQVDSHPTPRTRVFAFSRLGVVYVPQTCVPPSSAFETWLDGRVLGDLLDGIGKSHASKLKARLAELADMLMWPTLTYMASRGDTVFREEVMAFQVHEYSFVCYFIRKKPSKRSSFL